MTDAQWWTQEQREVAAKLIDPTAFAPGYCEATDSFWHERRERARLTAESIFASIPRPGASHEAAFKAMQEALEYAYAYIDDTSFEANRKVKAALAVAASAEAPGSKEKDG
jgi:uncharacterized membrane protein